ncbi:Chromatin associated protein KTI12 [Methanococcus vannielii SB]|uniref:Chromatin associated protein KTI12 n=1 Tax=Methanococcus vannielii (strain ATCC 35089 / DSM 1224 / JCM 13029 / OCM 148 / SB) TaxID=406327 RepID=A6UQD3_METVS|nr:L-seryl-tRNA(Sec) kinase [Methanococcus vannielii]ABR54705.1 Chromatin associated protein KTI12 [Methanococcus vannielii SB]
MIIILTGLPSVGKSTFSKTISKKMSEKNMDNIILGTDLLRESFPIWKESYEKYIRDSNTYLIKKALENKFSVIVDDTNYYNSKRRDLINIAKSYDTVYITIYLKAPLNILLTRNVQRGQKIPNEVIKDMYEKFDTPGSKYSWDLPDIEIDTMKKINYDEILNEILKISKFKNLKAIKKLENPKMDFLENDLQKIDSMSRQIVGNLIKTGKIDNKEIKKVSNIRKSFLKEFKSIEHEKINFKKIEEEFLIYLNENLKKDFI